MDCVVSSGVRENKVALRPPQASVSFLRVRVQGPRDALISPNPFSVSLPVPPLFDSLYPSLFLLVAVLPMAYSNGLFSAFSFIGFLLCAIPLHWHLEVWNIGTLLYMAWAGLGCLNAFINSVVWNNTVENKAPVWCDISSRFIVGVAVGLPAATLVISHRLYKIASRTITFSTRAEKRRAVCIDLAIGLGIPILQMALQIVVEGHRFDIVEEFGCYPHTYNTVVAFFLQYMWPVVLHAVTLVYSCASGSHGLSYLCDSSCFRS